MGNAPAFRYLEDLAPTGCYASWLVSSISARALSNWATLYGFQGVEPPEELHCTIMYSPEGSIDPVFHRSTWMEPQVVSEFTPRWLELFGPENDCLVLRFELPSAFARHRHFARLGAVYTYPEYAAHITLAKGNQPMAAFERYRNLPPQFPIVFDREFVGWVNTKD